MTKTRITIVGLGLIGTSIGMALSRETRDFEIIGHDKEPAAMDRAKKLKAIDRAEWNLINACDRSGMIILALPLGEIEATLRAVAADLPEGALVMDTAIVKAPVQAWADALLPPGVAFVGTHPIIIHTEEEAPRADLFQKRIWAVCPAPSTAEQAVKTTSDLVQTLGAQPLYLDAQEHDGVAAAVEQLPALVNMALLTNVISQAGWREMRQLAGSQFESSTRLETNDPGSFSAAMLSNQEQLLRWIDGFIDNLLGWRDRIAVGDEDTLHQAFAEAISARESWLASRASGHWEEEPPQVVERRGLLATWLGLGRKRPPRPGK